MQSSKSILTSRMYLVLVESLIVWFLPTLLLKIFSNQISDVIRINIAKGLLIFTIIDVIFCTCYVLGGFNKGKKINMELSNKNNEEKGDFKWPKQQVINL